MKLLTAFGVATAFLSSISWLNNSAAIASSGFIGTWCGFSSFAYTITDSPRLVVKQMNFEQTAAHYAGAQLVAERWHQTGTLSSDGNKISWSDLSTWVRTTSGAQYCGARAALDARTARAAEFRYLKGSLNVSAPIVYLGPWTAISNDGTEAYTCFSFKNTSSVTATRILFDLELLDEDSHVVAESDVDRTGTFSPNVEIRGWQNLREWASTQGHHDFGKNCANWTSQRQLEHRRVRSYYIGIKRIEYVDGTTWAPPAPSESPPRRRAR